MISILSAHMVEKPLNPDLSFMDISLLTLEAVIQVVLICLAGFVAARSGILTKAGQKVISLINVDLFTPCLVFIKLAPLLSLNKMADLIVIPIFFCIATFTSYVSARVTSKMLSLNGPETDFVTAMGVFGNSNSLPVSLTVTLAYTLPDLLWDQIDDDNSDRVASRGILYLLLFQQLGQILRWSWGFNHLLRKRSIEELSQYNDEPVTYRRIESGDALYINTPQQLQQAESVVSDRNLESLEEDAPLDAKSSTSTLGSMAARIRSVWIAFASWGPVKSFLSFMNPPLYAMLLSLVVGSVPLLQNLFFEKDTFVNNTVTQAVLLLGSVSIPLILVVLGSNLNPSDEHLPPSKHYNRIIFASLVSRMIIPSMILLPLIAACVKYINISILDDPIFLLVAFILTVSPPAIQLSQITQLNSIYETEMAGVLFWGYVVLTLPTTILIVVASLEVLKWAI
ncbi:hypothetical protein PUMCH_000684 [Australozyma saopauloensis]|uniref:Auxin efflux carrier n=1 Tax=Australozyma saopauloensis TaxID=291208 RepID=A0AAX4H4N8_9ASCO|nr:hypothetical protein PUMCH_000684 [[Candida] saopauloensis]